MISVRLPARSGRKTVASRLRVDVPGQERAEEERREEDAERAVPSEHGDGDRDEADLRRLDVGHAELELPAEHVDRAREPGERAGDRHRRDVRARDADAGVPRRVGIESDGAELEAERRAIEQERVDDETGEREEETDVEAL